MRAKHWLIGCILFTVSASAAMASSRGTQDLDSTSRTITDSTSNQHDGSGDVTDLTSHTSAPHGSVHNNARNAPGNNDDRPGSSGSAPVPVRQPHLGWQSLLPGSIQ